MLNAFSHVNLVFPSVSYIFYLFLNLQKKKNYLKLKTYLCHVLSNSLYHIKD